ncbi:platelet-activating factor acetylhydrolase IB subunit alpha1 isoform X2 [Antechinus flavipes]|uniref:platelet-activating factor acetylhydrolase IB subunit alpha1 isoform X2 n=1 Tax=Antechinus flavipes TaxID=38775 RepID=UPI002236BEB1|nr:platelet-activating factor acetylhydrolase IB subunit alpha1 isoform X2 [Antechinus flavipes]XP_051845456.1 platelet-activating factor acetylhydrolase IB subunit alpha1 isoform X2 [Antechinus flavipes]
MGAGCPCTTASWRTARTRSPRWSSSGTPWCSCCTSARAGSCPGEGAYLRDGAVPCPFLPQQLWRELFSPLHALNFGIGGDSTQHVLWRLENGELEHIRPKIVVVWVGTNNHGHTAEQVAAGIEAIVGLVNQRQPQARVVVLALLPRGQHPNPLRDKNRRVNELVRAALAGRPRAHFLDADPGFVHSDGTISHHDMYDYLHLTRLGYTPVCRALHALLLRLLAAGQGPPQPEPGP